MTDWLRDEVSDADPAPDVDAWTAWRPDELSARLADFDVPWAIAAGWAIDLFVGGTPRVHKDIEMVVARTSFPAVRAVLSDLEWYGAGGVDGEQRSL